MNAVNIMPRDRRDGRSTIQASGIAVYVLLAGLAALVACAALWATANKQAGDREAKLQRVTAQLADRPCERLQRGLHAGERRRERGHGSRRTGGGIQRLRRRKQAGGLVVERVRGIATTVPGVGAWIRIGSEFRHGSCQCRHGKHTGGRRRA